MPTADFARLHRELADDLSVWASLQVRAPLRRRLDPEDLTQEIWSRAYRDLPHFDAARGTFRAWLFGIAYNVLRKQLRSYHRRWRREDSGSTAAAAGASMVDQATSVGTRLLRSERAGTLLASIEALPEIDRQLVIYRGLEQLPYAEVGARLGLSAEAAESRWRRVRERLRTDLPD
jgi:RNA polymerase sigma-70 factor (ECF subfamily)